MNKVFSDHGYDYFIRTEDILHVLGCQQKWSRHFDEETRRLVRQVYQKDFDLICKRFGHCDFDQDTCLQGVPTMCPPDLFEWNESKKIACPKPGTNLTGVRTRSECSLPT